MISKYIFLGLISATFLYTTIPTKTNAQNIRPCGTFVGQLGDLCYQDVSVNARSGYPGSAEGTNQSTVFAGWRIQGYDRPATQAQFGQVNGPNITFVESGTNAQLIDLSESSNRELLDLKNRIDSEVKIRGITFGGYTDSINKSIQENQQRLNALSSLQSNVDIVKVYVKVQGRCTRSLPVVGCVDNQGGKYQGYVRVRMIYAGTAEQIRKDNEEAIAQAKNTLNSIISQTPKNEQTLPPNNEACPKAFSSDPFQGHTGKVAFYNEWNVPVTVILYHPDSKSIFNRYTVPPGQNNFLGDNIIVGDSWGVCFENKPGASGFVNNIGTISDYNPNYQGTPLFMIQNGRIK